MSKYLHIGERLREERERLGFSQTALAAIGGAGRKTQFNYETGERVPDGEYFSEIFKVGADIHYILTGEPSGTRLSVDEQMLLTGYRLLDGRGKQGVLAFIHGANAEPALPGQAKKSGKVVIYGKVGQQTKTDGDLTIEAMHIDMSKK